MDSYSYSRDFSEGLMRPDDNIFDQVDYLNQSILKHSLIETDIIKSQNSVISELEDNVSRLQTAAHGIDQMYDTLKDLADFLGTEVSFKSNSNIPSSVINNFIDEKLTEVKSFCQQTTFSGKRLLNGESGVVGRTEGKGLQFVRGSALVKSSGEAGYEVQVTRVPTASLLMGAAKLDKEILKKEHHIIVKDQKKEVCYELKPDESIYSLLNNLQKKLNSNGLDINVFQSRNNYLILKHNEPGDHTRFTGMSQNTALLSKIPGEPERCIPGQNVAGYINRELAYGVGGYLVGSPGNYRTDGLILFFNGSEPQAGESTGRVFVRQNGIQIPLSVEDTEMDLISLPDISPENMSVGVSNTCGFMNLATIRSNNATENIESIKLIRYAMEDLKDLQTELKRKESFYVELAISLLKNPVNSKEAGIGVVSSSHEKANEMAEQIKLMLIA